MRFSPAEDIRSYGSYLFSSFFAFGGISGALRTSTLDTQFGLVNIDRSRFRERVPDASSRDYWQFRVLYKCRAAATP